MEALPARASARPGGAAGTAGVAGPGRAGLGAAGAARGRDGRARTPTHLALWAARPGSAAAAGAGGRSGRARRGSAAAAAGRRAAAAGGERAAAPDQHLPQRPHLAAPPPARALEPSVSPQVAGEAPPSESPGLSFCSCEVARWNRGLERPGDLASY